MTRTPTRPLSALALLTVAVSGVLSEGVSLAEMLGTSGAGHRPTSGQSQPETTSSALPEEAPSQAATSTGQEDSTANAKPNSPESTSEPDAVKSVSNEHEGAALHDERLRLDQRHRNAWRETNSSSNLPRRAEVLSLTVSGGVSLGSYESGVVHLLTEALRRSPGAAQLKVVSGASAGSANALVAGTEACLEKVAEPEDSLGYKVWVNVGLDDLFDPARVTERNIFHRDALETGMRLVESEWKKGLPTSCDFVVGLTATREEGYEVHLARNLEVPRQAEKFAVRVHGRGPGQAPLLENYLDVARSFERPILPFSGGTASQADHDMHAVGQVVLASAAFPVAFDASTIEHCISPPRKSYRQHMAEPPQCGVATRVDRFVDGGVFDNNPLGLAVDVAKEGLLTTGAGPQFRRVPTGGPEPRPEVIYGFIDPDLRNYPLYEAPKITKDKQKDPVVGLLARLGGNILSSSRGRELAQLAEQEPDALERLWMLEASYPPISELLTAFFGFLERDFRDFDFHLGSYETYRDLRDHSGTILGVDPFLDQLQKSFRGPTKDIPKRYRKLGCILAHAEPDDYNRLAPLCFDEGQHNFRALLQVTIDRLWSNCRKVAKEASSESRNLQCKRAHGGLVPPAVEPQFRVKGARYQTDEESEFDYVMRLFSNYQFEFRDLGLQSSQANRGRLVVRQRLGAMVSALANAQAGQTDRAMVLTAGRTVLNGIEYEPPKNLWYLTFGTSLAGGYLHRIGTQRSLFFSADARVHRLRSLVSGHPEEFESSLTAGLDWALLPFSGALMQTRIGVRAGYQFAARDSAGTEACSETDTQSDSRLCSQFALHAPVTFTILERLHLGFTTIIYPVGQSWGHNPLSLEVDIGAEFF